MKIGETIRAHIAMGRTHKSVAMSWLAAFQARGRNDWAPDSIVSQFSRLVNDEPAGVRFFFSNREHAAVLLDVLEVSTEQRAEMLALGDAALKGEGGLPPRLVVDLTCFDAEREQADRLFDSIEALIVTPKPLQPVVLLLTPALFKILPRTFDVENAWLRWETIEDPDKKAERIVALANNQALVASPSRLTPPERWIAMSFNGRAITFEPVDGLESFAQSGALELPKVEHDLSEIVASETLPRISFKDVDGVAQRRMMVNLRREADAVKVDQDPRVRLAWARALGISATSTERDRTEHEISTVIAALGHPVKTVEKAGLESLLARAHRRHMSEAYARCGDEVHVVNPAEAQPGLEHPRVRVHRIAADTPILTRLYDAAIEMSFADWESDPFLLKVISRLDPDGRERPAFLYARAALLWEMKWKLAPLPPIENWRSALAKLFALEPPLASLRLEQDGSVVGDSDSDDEPRNSSARTMIVPQSPKWMVSAVERVQSEAIANALRFVPSPLASVIVGRDDDAIMLEPTRYRESVNCQIDISLPNGLSDPADVDAWLDLSEQVMTGKAARAENGRMRHVRVGVKVKIIQELPGFFEAADRHIALLWLALRRVVGSATAVRSQDGNVLFPLGGSGIVASVDIRDANGFSGDLVAAIDVDKGSAPGRHGWKIQQTVESGVHDFKFELPNSIVAIGAGVRVEIRFLASPLLLDAGGFGARTAIRRAGAARAEQAATEQAAYDDDDD